ncbi:MAG: hypothetical protein FWD34_00120 [Oscillospiraceae bacterium]|nr:hypothetical protein [Oscillospiraceae bacterium]
MKTATSIVFGVILGIAVIVMRAFFPDLFPWWTVFLITFAIIVIISIINILIQNTAIKKIDGIYDPDEKLAALNKAMKRFVGNEKSQPHKLLKCQLLIIAGWTDLSKADNNSAFTAFEEARIILTSQKPTAITRQSIKQHEINIYAGLAQCLTHMGRFDEAEQVLSYFNAPIDNPLSYCILQLVSADLLVHKGDTQRARVIIEDIAPKMQTISENMKRPDVLYDVILVEAAILMAEGDYEQARAKFESVLDNSGHYSHHREAREAIAQIENSLTEKELL